MSRYRLGKVDTLDIKTLTVQCDMDMGHHGFRVARIGLEDGATDTGLFLLSEEQMEALGFMLICFARGEDERVLTPPSDQVPPDLGEEAHRLAGLTTRQLVRPDEPQSPLSPSDPGE